MYGFGHNNGYDNDLFKCDYITIVCYTRITSATCHSHFVHKRITFKKCIGTLQYYVIYNYINGLNFKFSS